MNEGRTILAADDNEAHNYALQKMLENHGYKVLTAFTGKDTLKLAQQRPDIVLLDVNLPDVNGYEVCRPLKSGTETKHIPVVFISATHQTATAVNDAKEAGAETFLFHPVERDHLLAVIRGTLHKHTVS